jgi:hypothetical protein
MANLAAITASTPDGHGAGHSLTVPADTLGTRSPVCSFPLRQSFPMVIRTRLVELSTLEAVAYRQ